MTTPEAKDHLDKVYEEMIDVNCMSLETLREQGLLSASDANIKMMARIMLDRQMVHLTMKVLAGMANHYPPDSPRK